MKSFTIYEEYYELITLLTEEEQAYLLLAITRYMFEDIEPDLDERQSKIFKNLVRPLNISKANSKRNKKNQTETELKPNQNQIKTEVATKRVTHQDVNVNVNNSLCNKNNNNNNLFSLVEENFGRLLSPMEAEELQSWEDNELTRYAVKEAVTNGARSVRYITRILQSYQAKGIKTIAEAEADTKRFKERNSYKPKEPEWFDKEIKVSEASNSEREEMESLLSEFK